MRALDVQRIEHSDRIPDASCQPVGARVPWLVAAALTAVICEDQPKPGAQRLGKPRRLRNLQRIGEAGVEEDGRADAARVLEVRADAVHGVRRVRHGALPLGTGACDRVRGGRRKGRALETIEVDGLRIAYERAGNGPPLVLLHGYVGDGAATWGRQIEALADEFTVVAWDAPGAGRSADPPESFGMAGYADCLAGLIERLRLERPHVAGLSFGGALALEFFRRHSSIPRTLILASAYAGWAGSLPAEVAAQRLQQAMVLADLSPDEFVDALLPTMFSAGTSADLVDAFRASMLAFHPAGFREMARASAEDLRDVLPRIEIPTLLVYGDRDVRAPLTVAQDLHAAIADSRSSSSRTPVMPATWSRPTRSTARSAASSTTVAARPSAVGRLARRSLPSLRQSPSGKRVFQIACVTRHLPSGSWRQTSRKSPSSEIGSGAPCGRSVIA